LSTWDSYGHTPNKIANGDTADVTNDMFHRYPEDIQIMKQYGIHHYRFSIQWNRILPTGELKDGINEEGVKYYDDLINTLLENGVKPHVTIYHGETPLPLTGYLSAYINAIFRFRKFSNLVC
jgi:beta-glucosidase/6-phospho-beta-glucosidase/beta-galactosidase